MLYYNTGALRFAFVSACLLVGQFLVVWLRVLPYLHITYGPESTICERSATTTQPTPIIASLAPPRSRPLAAPRTILSLLRYSYDAPTTLMRLSLVLTRLPRSTPCCARVCC